MIGEARRYHLVGIGGSGMSGLASFLLSDGAVVSGSDLKEGPELHALRNAGARIDVGHAASHVSRRLDGVIVSSAIGEGNVEVSAARRRHIPIVSRLGALAEILSRYKSVGVAGTHGKSTTSAMTATILRECNLDPSFLIGAQCPALGGNASLGSGDWFVAEIDESDGLFVNVRPTIAAVTNIGRDHLHTYRGLDEIVQAFQRFVCGADQAVLTIDDPMVGRVAQDLPDALTVGTSPSARLRAGCLRHERFAMRFELILDDVPICEVCLPAPGVHNVRNALCAIGVALLAGIPPASAARALEAFRLPHRRFELLEENGVTVIDDYAHLPEEVEATLRAIREGWPGRRIVAVFQPHRYTRTRDMGSEFGTAFAQADVVVVSAIYAAGERPLPGVSANVVSDSIRAATAADVHVIPDMDRVLAYLEAHIRPGDFIVSFGAGDIWTVTESLAAFLIEGRFLEAGEPAG